MSELTRPGTTTVRQRLGDVAQDLDNMDGHFIEVILEDMDGAEVKIVGRVHSKAHTVPYLVTRENVTYDLEHYAFVQFGFERTSLKR